MTEQATPKPPLTTDEHEDRLEKGWNWLERYPNRRDWDERFERWVQWLRSYEQHITGEGIEITAPVQESLL